MCQYKRIFAVYLIVLAIFSRAIACITHQIIVGKTAKGKFRSIFWATEGRIRVNL